MVLTFLTPKFLASHIRLSADSNDILSHPEHLKPAPLKAMPCVKLLPSLQVCQSVILAGSQRGSDSGIVLMLLVIAFKSKSLALLPLYCQPIMFEKKKDCLRFIVCTGVFAYVSVTTCMQYLWRLEVGVTSSETELTESCGHVGSGN